MTTVALALAALAIVQALAFTGIVARQSRAHARREDLLVNQILHLSGRTWQPAPAAEKPAATEKQLERRAFTQTPEQLPVH